jgi:hypothetical protein
MIDIEKYGRQAISILRDRYGLPESGFIAGGSIANIVWELVSGNKAVVNDIDVFRYIGKIEESEVYEITKDGKKLSFLEKETQYFDDYNGMNFRTSPSKYYIIDTSSKDGIFNYVDYRSSTPDVDIIINSFDINCTTIGYDISTDRLFWLKSFDDFLKTGELKVCSLTSPSHTVIRLYKKSIELNAKFSNMEFDLLSCALCNRYSDLNRTKFSTRYAEMYEKYSEYFSDKFKLNRESGTEVFLKTKGLDLELYSLSPINLKNINGEEIPESDKIFSSIQDLIFKDSNLSSIYSSKHFLFYIRNIYRNEKLKNIWMKTKFFFDSEDYIDVTIIDDKELDLLSRLASHAPNTIKNLKDYRLSTQLSFVTRLLDKYKDDPLIGIAILEKYKLSDINLNDDSLLMLQELTVRKNIVDDPRNKAKKVLHGSIDNIETLW